jgi:hypothetical protein
LSERFPSRVDHNGNVGKDSQSFDSVDANKQKITPKYRNIRQRIPLTVQASRLNQSLPLARECRKIPARGQIAI